MAGEKFRQLVNVRPPSFEEEVFDLIRIPEPAAPGEFVYRLTELPLNVPLPNPDSSAIEVRRTDSLGNEYPGPDLYTPVYTGDPLVAGSFTIYDTPDPVDLSLDTFRFGRIKFNQLDGGDYLKIVYTGRGSLVFAEDVVNNSTGEAIIEGAIKPAHLSTDPADTYTFPGDVTINGDLNLTGTASAVLQIADQTAENALVATYSFPDDAGKQWFRLDTKQFKGWNGNTGNSGQDGIVILG